MIEEPVHSITKAGPNAHRRIWIAGAFLTIAIAASAGLNLLPLRAGLHENAQVRADDRVLQQVTDLHSALNDWQVYLEARIPKFSATASNIDPLDLAKGSQIAQTIATDTPVVLAALRSNGAAASATPISAASAAFFKSLNGLAPLSAGRPAAVITTAVAAERAAFAEFGTALSTAEPLVRAQSIRDQNEGDNHLDTGARVMLFTSALAALGALAFAIVLGERARRRENADRTAAKRRTFETMMQQALEMSKSESDVYHLLDEALRLSVPDLEVEMLVADSSRAHFHQTLNTPPRDADTPPRSGCGVMSPLDCPATARGHTLVFPTSTALDACPYLKNRETGACSAVCVAISLTGKTVGVLHARGADHVTPSEGDVRHMEITTRRAAERIAMLRAFEKSEAQARSDPLTGLWNRRTLEDRVHDLRQDGATYAIAYGDLDHFKELNDTYGHETGDQALRLFAARLARLRPPERHRGPLRRRGIRDRPPRLHHRDRSRCARTVARTTRAQRQRRPHPRLHGQLRTRVLDRRRDVRRGRRGRGSGATDSQERGPQPHGARGRPV